jgi:predicted alpha/beta hydrolase family esterase
MRKNTDWIVQFHSPDDPMIRVEEGRFVAEKLKSEYTEIPDRGHFTIEQMPEVVKVIEEKCPQKPQ